MGEIARGENVRDDRAKGARGAAGLGEMHLDEAAVPAAEPCERMQPLDDAGALRPAAAHARRISHHRHLAGPDRGLALPAELRGGGRSIKQRLRWHVFNLRAGRQAVHRQADD